MQEARMRHMLGLILALAAITPRTTAVVYLFGKPEYSFNEDSGTQTVDIHRSLVSGESNGEVTIALTTDCPTDCSHVPSAQLATEMEDFTLTKTATFDATKNQATVSISITDDTEDEFTEYFCLAVADPNTRGSQWYTKIIIPWNDDCVELLTPADGGNSDSSVAYYVATVETARNGYVGPWSGSSSATISVTPQYNSVTSPWPGGDGKDINIFLVNSPDFNSLNEFYGIHLDDSEMGDSSQLGTNGVTDGSFVSDSDIQMVVGSVIAASDYVVSDQTNTFELTYNAGTISLDRTSSPPITAISEEDTSTPLTSIGHLIVSSAKNKYAFWKVCGLDYKLLPTKSASASGQLSSNESPDRAIDGDRGPYIATGSCFVSAGTDPNWLQIDLGREFEVNKVIIFPVIDDGSTTVDATWLDNARVYVGSCRNDNITGNTPCSSDIGTAPVSGGIIEVTCDPPGNDKAYGRYVYILQSDGGTDPLALCEVQVFGDEVPIADETKVEFSTNETVVGEGVGDAMLTLTRTGEHSTCTYVEYYTDISVNDADFTDVPSTAPVEILINSDSTKIPITITDDAYCEDDETFNVYLTDVEGGRLGTQCSTIVEITDDDMVTYALTMDTFSADSEGQALSIGVTRSGSGTMQDGKAVLTFSDGTARVDDNDYSNKEVIVEFTAAGSNTVQKPVQTKEDYKYEGDETFTVSLGYLEPSTCSVVGSPSSAMVTIPNDESKFKWDVSGTSITIKEGDAAKTFMVSREGVAETQLVDIIVDGDGAETPADFTVSPSSLRFTGTSTSGGVTVNIMDDSAVENPESFTLTLRDPDYMADDSNLGDPYIITVNIEDNDAEYRWEKSSYSVDEGDGEVLVCLVRAGDTTTSKTIQITSEGGNTQGLAQSLVDFTPLTQVMFTSLDGEKKCMPVAITGDSNIEATETFTLTITQTTDIAIGSPSVTTVTIRDDDATVNFERNSYSFSEGSTGGSVTIEKSGNQVVTFNVVSTTPSTATSDEDFEAISTSVTIPAGSNSYNLRVRIRDDDEYEQDEVFTLTLSIANVQQDSATITIENDDPAPTEAPSGLGTGAIAAIAVSSIIAVITCFIAIVFLVYMYGGGTFGASAAGSAAAGGAAGANASLGDYGNFGFPSSPYEAANLGFGNTGGLGMGQMGNSYFGPQYQ